MYSYSINDTLTWSIELAQVFPKFYFHRQDFEKELVTITPIESRSLGFSIGKVLNNRFEFSVGIQMLNRRYYLQYEPKKSNDIDRINHHSVVWCIPIVINSSEFKNRFLKIKLQTGLVFSMLDDQIIKEYLSPSITMQSGPDFVTTSFVSGLIGLRLEKDIIKERFCFSIQSNYVHKLTNYSPRFNSTNRLSFDFGIKYRFKI